MNPLDRLLLLLFAAAALTFGYIDLEWGFAVGRYWVNAPVVDVIALGFLAAWLWRRVTAPDETTPWPGRWVYLGFMAIALASAVGAVHRADALHEWARKFVFYYAAFGVAMSHWIARRSDVQKICRLLLIGVLALAAVSVVTSFTRWGSGESLWHVALEGLTPNHKTLAVALAPCLPLALGWRGQTTDRERWWANLVIALLVGAVALSASKAAWICLAYGAMLWFPNRERAWGWRARFAVPFVLIGVSAAIYAPVLVGSKAMLDAARSRHSLNVRAVQMVASHPVLGAGPGSSVEIEMVEFPHYRVNGVDAHGVVQKIAGETGLGGLLAYGAFAGVVLITAVRRRRLSDTHAGAAGTILVLHLSLLLSTETFSPTHWFVFAVAWGLLHGPRPGAGR